MQEQFFDIYDLYYEPFYTKPLFWAFIILVFFTVFSLLFYFLKKKKVHKLTYWELALQELSMLNVAQCDSKEKLKKFYFTLSEILKTYLQVRYGISLRGKTDDEVLIYLKSIGVDENVSKILHDVLLGSVQVRFGDVLAMQDQAVKDLAKSKMLIEISRPVT